MHSKLIQKITAPNASMFTGGGTNTYLIGKEEITIVDPGPNIETHINEIANAVGEKATRILVTHTHRDHSPGVRPLKDILNVPSYGLMVEQDDGHQDKTFTPDKVLGHGDVIDCEEYKIEVIHTPGHASNHLCYLVHDASTLITGDHIMNGSTVVIAPPDGNMKQYLSSLKLLKDYPFDYIAPGHGDYLEDPVAVVDWIINHRLQRESKVHECLKKISPCDVNDLVKLVYDDVDPKLHPIALWSLTAHLEKLEEDGIAVLSEDKKIWSLN